MTDLSLATQDATFARLKLGGPPAPVFQHVPDNTQPPAIIVGAITVENQGGKDSDFERHEIEVQSFYRGPARKGLFALQAYVKDRLHNARLSVVGATFHPMRQLTSTDELDEDGITYAGTQRFETYVQPAD